MSFKYFDYQLGITPDCSYIINHIKKIIYCPIPKVANSSFRLWLYNIDLNLISENINYDDNLITYSNNNCTLINYTDIEKREIMLNKNYYKIVFVRNPFSKLVSAYLNLIIFNDENEPPEESIIYIYSILNIKNDINEKISFSEFIDYIINTPDDKINYHLKSQYLFLQDYEFDFIGKYENINDDIKTLSNKFNISIPFPHINSSKQTKNILDYCIKDFKYSKLKIFENNIPHWKSFYDNELVNKVSKRYEMDLIKFNYKFE
jgi:hypothetical protein